LIPERCELLSRSIPQIAVEGAHQRCRARNKSPRLSRAGGGDFREWRVCDRLLAAQFEKALRKNIQADQKPEPPKMSASHASATELFARPEENSTATAQPMIHAIGSKLGSFMFGQDLLQDAICTNGERLHREFRRACRMRSAPGARHRADRGRSWSRARRPRRFR